MPHGGKREGAGRKSKGNHLNPRAIEEIKIKIKTGAILKRLHGLVMGNIQMTSAAVAAAGIMLKKVLPDLQAVEHSGEVTTIRAELMNDDELATVARRGSDHPAETAPDPAKLN